MKTRSWIIRVAVCLLLGLALNFAAAYACAWWSPITETTPAFTEARYSTRVATGERPPFLDGRGFGVRRLIEHRDSETYRTTQLGVPLTSLKSYDIHVRLRYITGIPVIGGIFSATRTDPPFLKQTKRFGLDRTWSLLPLGTTINTLFYAALLFALWFTPRILIRWNRARRGRCTRCAYDIMGVAICPECGTATPLGTSPS
ncbi:MAG: hypothetical protein H6812_12675 [Phycisphaeraceae bacterium]|nr:hypothetical protein [Phycisphaerales bacterium]MCB9844090.1 hypothetical protein [Phycisphaeraceae bacterium]